MALSATEAPPSIHPLDPLSAAEIERAWEIVRGERALGPRVRVIFVMLHEPAKKVVLEHRPGEPVDRAAFVVLIDSAAGKTYEAIVSLAEGRVLSWEHIPGAQPAIVLDEFTDCEAAVRADPRWQAAMRKRGVTDFEPGMVDCWSAGNFGFAADEGRRLVRALTWVRRHPGDNGYARPVENLLTVVDLNAMKVRRGRGRRRRARCRRRTPTTRRRRPATRTGPQAHRDPPAGGPELHASTGHELRWQKWRLRIGFTPREGLVLHTVTYEDQGRERPGPLPGLGRGHGGALRRPAPDLLPPQRLRRGRVRHRHARQLAGQRLRLPGRDPLSRRAWSTTAGADAVTLPNAVCIHEEDAGILWKHVDWRHRHHRGAPLAAAGGLVHRHRRQLRVRLLLVLLPGRHHPARGQADRRHLERGRAGRARSRGGASWSRPGVYGPIHQHFFNVAPRHDGGRARATRSTRSTRWPIRRAREPARTTPSTPSRRCCDRRPRPSGSSIRSAGRFWKIANPSVRNRLGQPVGLQADAGRERAAVRGPGGLA